VNKIRKILVVDDEPHVPRVLKIKLEPEGWQVDMACNGAEALAYLEAASLSGELPDALITDMMMPVMDGRALCHALVERFPDRPFPIFVMTSMVERDVREWVDALGGITFLEKPVSPRKVLLALQRQCVKETE